MQLVSVDVFIFRFVDIVMHTVGVPGILSVLYSCRSITTSVGGEYRVLVCYQIREGDKGLAVWPSVAKSILLLGCTALSSSGYQYHSAVGLHVWQVGDCPVAYPE